MEFVMDAYPSGSYIVMEATIEGQKLYLLGYKYNSSKVLTFLCSENAGLFQEGKPYIARFPDGNGNVNQREVPRPSVISDYFSLSNVVDVHNQLWQFSLRLEKSWVTHCPWFRILTSVLGFTITDAYQLSWYQSMNESIQSMSMTDFADRMAWDLINNSDQKEVPSVYLSSSAPTSIATSIPPTSIVRSSTSSAISSLSGSSFPDSAENTNAAQDKHKLITNPKKEPSGRARRCKCYYCGKKTTKICGHKDCGDEVLRLFFCVGKCFDRHTQEMQDSSS